MSRYSNAVMFSQPGTAEPLSFRRETRRMPASGNISSDLMGNNPIVHQGWWQRLLFMLPILPPHFSKTDEYFFVQSRSISTEVEPIDQMGSRSSFFTLAIESEPTSLFQSTRLQSFRRQLEFSTVSSKGFVGRMSYWINSLLSYLISNTAPSNLEPSKITFEPPKAQLPPQYSGPPPSLFEPICHPLVKSVTDEVDGYFLQHWDFPNEKARKKFVAAGFSRVTCLYFPKALDDRIHFACRLLTVLFLIDGEPSGSPRSRECVFISADLLDDMSLEDGSAYNEKLIPISRGHVLPDRSVPVEYIIFDLWESMRAHDKEMADEVLEPTFVFMRAQTDKTRTKPMGLGPYFEYREKDVGKAYADPRL